MRAIEMLKGQPLVLALLLVNLIYMVGGIVLYHDAANRSRSIITELIRDCAAQP